MATFEWIYREFSPLLIVYGMLLAATLLARFILSLRKSDVYTVTAPDGRKADIRLSTSLTREQRAAIFRQTLENLKRGPSASSTEVGAQKDAEASRELPW